MNKPKLIIFSGAGLSVESGLSAFRGPSGLWNDHNISDVCSFNTWKQNYDLVTKFYDDLRVSLKEKIPHSGFDIFHRLAECYNVKHYTTNVDDLYEKSGLNCTHIHGELTKIMCMTCKKQSDIGYITTKEAKEQGLILHNENCHNEILKPAVTFYGESYYDYPGFFELQTEIRNIEPDDTILTIGSSLEVIPVDYWLRHIRCHKYNINPDKTAGYNKDFKHWKNILMPATKGLEEFVNILKKYNANIK